MMMFLSYYLIPLMIFYIIGFGVLSGRPVFDDFLRGAKSGMHTVADILPTLVGLIVSVGVLRASGFLDSLAGWLSGPAEFLHIPAPLVPLTLVRLVSNSAATGLVLDIFETYGVDSYLGLAASVLMSCTETVLYCMSVYFGSVKVTKTGYTLTGALLATAAGAAVSIWIAGFL